MATANRRRGVNLGRLGAGVGAGAFFAAGQALAVPTLVVPPNAPGMDFTYVHALNADGSVATGASHRFTGVDPFGHPVATQAAWRWDRNAAPQAIVPAMSYAYDCDATGNMAVGVTGAFVPFLWTSSGGVQNLPGLPGRAKGEAQEISADGSVIVGVCHNNFSGPLLAARWTKVAGVWTAESLGTLPNFAGSYAYAVNADGSVIAGEGNSLFRWTAADGLEDLGTLPYNPSWGATPTAINADGSVIVGTSYFHGFRWTRETGLVEVPPLAGAPVSSSNDTAVQSTSADGNVLVGYSNHRAFVWTPAMGTVDLNVYLPTVGIDLSGWNLTAATAISGDGAVIGGNGTLNGVAKAWIASGLSLGEPACAADLDDGSGTGTPNGGVDINDLLYFLTKFEGGDSAVDLDNGSGQGVPDGGVDISDLLFFLARFEAGC